MKKIFIFLLLSCSYIHATGFYPVANFVINYQLSLLKVGGTVVFNASSSYDPDTQNGGYTPTWIWDFNYDGVTFTNDLVTTNAICSHIYNQSGIYRVAVKYIDNDRWVSSIKTLQIEIIEEEYFYYVKDHLGSIKMTLDEDGIVVGHDDYYPFGMVMPGRSMNNSNPNSIYKFTGKERDEETHYDYFGDRYYDSRIGRWLSVDPLADKYAGWSPYNYVMNNPLILIDPDGREVRVKTEDDAKRFIKDVNSLYANAPVSYQKVTEEHSFLFGIFNWTSEHYVINADGGGSFDWSQDNYASGLYDAIATTENVFNVNYVDGKKFRVHPYSLYSIGGGHTDSDYGGANINISYTGHNTRTPRAVVMMHELVGHGHPVGGNHAHDIDRFYGYPPKEGAYDHPGYHENITWKKTGLFQKKK